MKTYDLRRTWKIDKAATASVTSLAASATVQTAVASNPLRIDVVIHNATNRDLYVKYGAGASSSDLTEILPSDSTHFLSAGYTGIVTVTSPANGSGNIHITEV